MYCTVLCTVLYCTVQVGTGVALDVAGAGLEVGVGVGGAALDIATKLTAWSSVTILDLAGCSAKLGVEIGMGAAGTAIGAFQAAAAALGQLGGCVGIGGKCNLEYPTRPCFYKALSNRPKGASKQSSQYSYSTLSLLKSRFS